MRIDPGVRKVALALVVICVACCAFAYVSTREPRRKGFEFRVGPHRLELSNFTAVRDPTWIEFDAAAWRAATPGERPRMLRSLFLSGALDTAHRDRAVLLLGAPLHEVSLNGALYLSWPLGDVDLAGRIAPCFLSAECRPGKAAQFSFEVPPQD